jgi:hypothetical protein
LSQVRNFNMCVTFSRKGECGAKRQHE